MSEPRSRRPRVKADIQSKLARSVASGEIAAGETLPSEVELCARYGVSRTALREAIKGLEAKGMLRSKPRVGTFALPREEWALLDGEVLGWVAEMMDVEEFTDAVLEARRAIEPAAAVLACKRASLADLARIEEALDRMERAGGDPDAFTEADLAFHEAVLRASRNLVFVRFVHTIRAGLNLMLLASNKSVEDYTRTVERHRALLTALVARDESAALSASIDILSMAREDLAAKRATGAAKDASFRVA